MIQREAVDRCRLFQGLSPSSRDLVASLGTVVSFQAGERIFDEGEEARRLYVIHQGRVALQMRAPEEESDAPARPVVVAVLGEGESLGWSALVPPYVLTMSAVCVDPTVLVALDGRALRRLISLDWEIGYHVMSGLVDLIESRLASIRTRFAQMKAAAAFDLRAPAVRVADYLEAVLAGSAGEITDDQRHILERCRLRLAAQIDRLDRLLRVPGAGAGPPASAGDDASSTDDAASGPGPEPASQTAGGLPGAAARGAAPADSGLASGRDRAASGPVGAAMVVGGGIAGIQAALDLADAGIQVYLVERGPSIGGRMATLDKTFPTNDCAMCILAPKMTAVKTHPNITLWTYSEVERVDGDPGRFRVAVKRLPRYVIEERCQGCRECIDACVYREPKFSDEFNLGLGRRKPVYIPFPQAVPLVAVIDPQTCIEFRSGRCKKTCVEACGERGAIDFHQEERIEQIEVGAVVLAPGIEPFDAALAEAYGAGRFPNVLTGPQFERMLSASGPTQGHVRRPSDGAGPRRIAFLQCVGSRDQRYRYCSAVCCMYATKEAILAREHMPAADCTIYYADLRAFGKGFDAYIERARGLGVRYVRTRVAALREDPRTRSLQFRVEEDGQVREEEADLVVLAVGLTPPRGAAALAQAAGVEIDAYGFARTDAFVPLQTSRPGVFAAGGFRGPKDIPDSVADGSGAAAAALAVIGSARGTRIAPRIYPPELALDPAPRIGVFVCHCGSNIAGVVDVASLAAYARTLPGVVLAETSLYSCSTDSLGRIKRAIAEEHLNRVVVASCTPRTHEAIFRDALREAGLNPYLFEMANIRDQCTWVHAGDPPGAAEKARALISASVARAALLQPLHRVPVPMRHEALVVGGGLAGLTAALNLADQGFPVILVEREPVLGGRLRSPLLMWDGAAPAAEVLDRLVARVRNHPLVEVLTGHRVATSRGTVGSFETTLAGPDGERTVRHGATVIATGVAEWQPAAYGAGEDPRVITLSAFERLLLEGAWAPEAVWAEQVPRSAEQAPRSVVMLLCAGPWDRIPFYCSRTCCSQSLAAALAFKRDHPEASVAVMVREVRTYGFAEEIYTRARGAGIQVFRYGAGAPPAVVRSPEGIYITVRDESLGGELTLAADLLVVAPAQVASEGASDLSTIFKVPATQEGFFLEAHVKLRPADFASEGLFLCGSAHYPKPVGEAIAHALAASARASTLLWRDSLEVGGVVASVDRDRCTTCLTCLRLCAYEAVTFDGDGIAVIDPARCQGCGVCVAACPGAAMSLGHYTRDQMLAKIDALLLEAACVT